MATEEAGTSSKWHTDEIKIEAVGQVTPRSEIGHPMSDVAER
ncbi:hypothetical protein [Pandoraea communis]|nr:hypothetical protein [Pandoraea communis]MDM8355897.1 hypothetical protein [Pandoraea communis]